MPRDERHCKRRREQELGRDQLDAEPAQLQPVLEGLDCAVEARDDERRRAKTGRAGAEMAEAGQNAVSSVMVKLADIRLEEQRGAGGGNGPGLRVGSLDRP